MFTRLLKPGYLVGCRTTVTGASKTTRRDISTRTTVDGATVREWESEKVTYDPEEEARAKKAAGEAAYQIRRLCAWSEFGLICPCEREGDLDAAIREGQRIAGDYNAGAASRGSRARVGFWALPAVVANRAEEATRAIAAEVRGLLDAIQSATASLDVGAIRTACDAAVNLSRTLDAEAEGALRAAVDEARTAAKLMRRLVKAGRDASEVLPQIQQEAQRVARGAFLRLEEAPAPAPIETAPARGLALDAPAPVDAPPAPAPARPVLVLDESPTPANGIPAPAPRPRLAL